MTVPLFLAGVYCNADEIKKMIVHPPGISKQYAGFVVFQYSCFYNEFNDA